MPYTARPKDVPLRWTTMCPTKDHRGIQCGFAGLPDRRAISASTIMATSCSKEIDGFHPSASGYSEIAKQTLAVLQKAGWLEGQNDGK